MSTNDIPGPPPDQPGQRWSKSRLGAALLIVCALIGALIAVPMLLETRSSPVASASRGPEFGNGENDQGPDVAYDVPTSGWVGPPNLATGSSKPGTSPQPFGSAGSTVMPGVGGGSTPTPKPNPTPGPTAVPTPTPVPGTCYLVASKTANIYVAYGTSGYKSSGTVPAGTSFWVNRSSVKKNDTWFLPILTGAYSGKLVMLHDTTISGGSFFNATCY